MPLLPNEPRVIDETVQQALTEQFLMPAIGELMVLFVDLRQSLDTKLSQLRPLKQDKPYPLGQCLEISEAIFQHLRNLNPCTLKPEAACGFNALRNFVRVGGSVRQVWGDLRGEYFQNALLLGTLYVDVANDTVNPYKHPVEILPFAEAKFAPINDFYHFSMVAARYWQACVYPNHLIPSLAPYFPLISLTADGFVQVQSASNYMIALTQAGAFYPSESVLKEALMAKNLFNFMHGRLAALSVTLAAEPKIGQTEALAMCACYREQREVEALKQRDRSVREVLHINAELARFRIKIK